MSLLQHLFLSFLLIPLCHHLLFFMNPSETYQFIISFDLLANSSCSRGLRTWSLIHIAKILKKRKTLACNIGCVCKDYDFKKPKSLACNIGFVWQNIFNLFMRNIKNIVITLSTMEKIELCRWEHGTPKVAKVQQGCHFICCPASVTFKAYWCIPQTFSNNRKPKFVNVLTKSTNYSKSTISCPIYNFI